MTKARRLIVLPLLEDRTELMVDATSLINLRGVFILHVITYIIMAVVMV